MDGFDQMDADAIVTGLSCPFIKSMDNEYTKIARSLLQKYSAKVNDGSKASNEPVNDEAGAML